MILSHGPRYESHVGKYVYEYTYARLLTFMIVGKHYYTMSFRNIARCYNVSARTCAEVQFAAN
jgi:hypothetical protein